MTPLDELLMQVPTFKEHLPMRARVCIFLSFIIVFQLSGGIYLSSLNEMVGEKALLQEDILMAALASFLGISMIFPILFRLKFRLTTRLILQTVCVGLIVCNLICMYTRSEPVLVGTCFVAGILRMWGTFECFSTIQLRITPTRNFAVFFPVIYCTVFGCIQISGLLTTYLGYYYHWHYMHWFIIGLLLIVIFVSRMVLRHFHIGKPMPLYGIDWLGAVMWSVGLLLLIFVANYGDHYNWFNSPLICVSLVTGIACVSLNIGRMFHIRHPYIDPQVYRFPKVVSIIALFAALALLSSTATVLQGAYTGGILHYDSLNSVSLNWPALFGTVAGAVFTLYALVKLHLTYKQVTIIGFICILLYQVEFYFLISPDTKIEQLYLPLFIKNFGNVAIYIALTVYLQQMVPFLFFFQALGAVGFVREGIGSPIANAIVGRVFKICLKENYLSLGGELDIINPTLGGLPWSAIYNELQRQALLVSLKEVYGYAVLASIVFLLIVLLMRYKHIVRYVRVPPVEVVRRLMDIRKYGKRSSSEA